MQNVGVTERAFQIAGSGAVSNVLDIRRALHREGYAADALQGPTLLKQLLSVIKAAGAAGDLGVKPPISDEAAVPAMPEDVAKDYDGAPM
jgi:hypothetical protein